jgi:cobalt-zinc-cadmium efflux system outer membrane protein
MTMRLCVVTLAVAAAASLQAQQPGAPLTLEGALAQALQGNPTIAAARLRRAVDLQGVDVARERPNPELRVEIEREAPKDAYAIALPIETGAKRGRRIALGEATLRTGDAEIAQTIVDVRAAVRRGYFARIVADARLLLLSEIRDLARRTRDAAQQRFEAGSVPRLELVQAELALLQAENETVGARALADGARVQLNTLLGFPLDAAPALGATLDSGNVPPLATALDQARAASAELAVLDRGIDEQRARIALAQAMQVPDVTPEATLTRRAEPEFQTGWRAAVSIAIPVFTRHTAGVRLEQAALTRLESERAAAVARLTGDVAAAAALAEAQRAQLVQYRDRILPQAQELERMAQDAYQLGQTGIAPLLLALQATRDARIRSLETGEQFQSTLADLERAMGVTIR